jgi:hypothetical protein
VTGAFWIVVRDTFEAACETCAESYGDPRIT